MENFENMENEFSGLKLETWPIIPCQDWFFLLWLNSARTGSG